MPTCTGRPGRTHLVSLGDLLDRGDDSRKVMDLLMRLQVEAAAAGGQVHVVVGNHEAMNVLGDLRYVSRGDYAAYAGDEDAATRDARTQGIPGPPAGPHGRGFRPAVPARVLRAAEAARTGRRHTESGSSPSPRSSS